VTAARPVGGGPARRPLRQGRGGRMPVPRPAATGDVAALVLAGGYSERMQAFKPLLPLAGAAVLERAVATFQDGGVPAVTVVVGHRGAELRPLVERLGARCVVNPAYDQGMYTSVLAGVRALPRAAGACLVLPADMPAVRPRTVGRLVRAWRRTGAPVVYPAFQGARGHPPLVSRRLFPAILRGSGQGGLRAVLQGVEDRAVTVDVLDQGVLLDLDTPADYQEACRELADRAVPTAAECEALLAGLGVDPAVVRHCRAVAAVGERLALELAGAGGRLDLPLVRAACLLHDLAKGKKDHAAVGARRLAHRGYPRVARVVAAHTDLPAGERGRLGEAAVLYLADKLVQGDRPVQLRERFRVAAERCAGSRAAQEALARRWAAAGDVASRVEEALGHGALARLVAGLRGAEVGTHGRRG
jgi:molybdenum cofactor cytidylyltransferase